MITFDCYFYYVIGLCMGGVAPRMGSKFEDVKHPWVKVLWIVFCFASFSLLCWLGNKMNVA